MRSASGADREFGCPPSGGAFPRAYTTGESAERGNEIHAFARRVTLYPNQRADALLEISDDEWRATALGMNFDDIYQDIEILGSEWAYVVDLEKKTAIKVGENIERQYEKYLGRELGKYEFGCSIDIVGRIRGGAYDGVLVELDFKTGRYLGDPATKWQRRICSMALAFSYDETEVFSRLAYINEDGSVFPDGCIFNLMELHGFADEGVEHVDRIERAKAEMAAGKIPAVYPSDSNCQFCPSMMYCPFWLNMAKAVVDDTPAMTADQVKTLDPKKRLQAWDHFKTAEKIGEMGIKALKELAKREPISDGKYVVGPADRSKKGFDAAAARGLLKMKGATDEEIAQLFRDNPYQEYRKKKVA